MIVLAVDPGNVNSAWVVFDSKRGVLFRNISANEDLLSMIRSLQGRRMLEDTHIDRFAVEMVESFGMAVGKEVFETVYWIGRFSEAWQDDEHATRLYRKQIKIHLCGTTQAKDPNVRQALLDRLGPPGTKKQPGPTYGIAKDLWSALAVAVTYCDLSEVNR